MFVLRFFLVSVNSCLRNTAGKYTKTSSTRQIVGSFLACFVAERHIIQQRSE